jgi:hypothetical protein
MNFMLQILCHVITRFIAHRFALTPAYLYQKDEQLLLGKFRAQDPVQ